MKRYLLAAMATMMLVACNPGSTGIISSPAPAGYADLTVADEQAAIGAEASYLAASMFGTMLVQSGSLDKARFKAIDAHAFRALQLVRAAYTAGNATGLKQALDQFKPALAALQHLNQE